MFVPGEPLWLSGKVMERENKRKQKIPGLLPSPGNLLKKYVRALVIGGCVGLPKFFHVYVMPHCNTQLFQCSDSHFWEASS
jgi:hypothetical protein